MKAPGVNAALTTPFAASVTAYATISPAAALGVSGGGATLDYQVLVDDDLYAGGNVSGAVKITLQVIVKSTSLLASPPTVSLKRGTATKQPAGIFHDQTTVDPVIL